jgi:hypothetical protein
MYIMENHASNNSSIGAYVFVAALRFLLSRCLAKIGGYVYRVTDRWEEFMKYAIEIGSDAMIYTSRFIKTDSGIRI